MEIIYKCLDKADNIKYWNSKYTCVHIGGINEYAKYKSNGRCNIHDESAWNQQGLVFSYNWINYSTTYLEDYVFACWTISYD